MQTATLDAKTIKLELFGEWIDKLLDPLLEESKEIKSAKKEFQSRIFIYHLSFPFESSFKVAQRLKESEDILGYCADIYYKVLEGSFPQINMNNLHPIKPKCA